MAAFRYQIDGELGAVTNCHCSLCRKMSGSAFSSGSTIPTASFRFVAGEDLLKEWESSPGYHRVFCGRCGSPILKKKDKDAEHLRFRPGTLDSDPGVKASKHIHDVLRQRSDLRVPRVHGVANTKCDVVNDFFTSHFSPRSFDEISRTIGDRDRAKRRERLA